MIEDRDLDRARAEIIVLIARLDGIEVDVDEVADALGTCRHADDEPCELVALIERRGGEQGVAWLSTPLRSHARKSSGSSS